MSLLRLASTRLPHHSFIVVGDFNLPDIRWSPSPHRPGRARAEVTRASRRATDFLDACELAGLVQHVSQPTRGDSTLDLVLTSRLQVETTVRCGVFESDPGLANLCH